MVDDGSTDGSRELLRGLRDPKFRIFFHETNQGLSRTLNDAIERSVGTLIARLDQDDACLFDRLERQVDHLESYRKDQVVGGQILRKTHVSVWNYPLSAAGISARCAFGPPFAHPAVMMRREVATYRPAYDYAEDWDLWDRLAQNRISWANLREPVLIYGESPEGMSRRGHEQQDRSRSRVSRNILARMGIFPAKTTIQAHLSLTQPRPGVSVQRRLALLWRLMRINGRRGLYPRSQFAWECGKRILSLLRQRQSGDGCTSGHGEVRATNLPPPLER